MLWLSVGGSAGHARSVPRSGSYPSRPAALRTCTTHLVPVAHPPPWRPLPPCNGWSWNSSTASPEGHARSDGSDTDASDGVHGSSRGEYVSDSSNASGLQPEAGTAPLSTEDEFFVRARRLQSRLAALRRLKEKFDLLRGQEDGLYGGDGDGSDADEDEDTWDQGVDTLGEEELGEDDAEEEGEEDEREAEHGAFTAAQAAAAPTSSATGADAPTVSRFAAILDSSRWSGWASSGLERQATSRAAAAAEAAGQEPRSSFSLAGGGGGSSSAAVTGGGGGRAAQGPSGGPAISAAGHPAAAALEWRGAGAAAPAAARAEAGAAGGWRSAAGPGVAPGTPPAAAGQQGPAAPALGPAGSAPGTAAPSAAQPSQTVPLTPQPWPRATGQGQGQQPRPQPPAQPQPPGAPRQQQQPGSPPRVVRYSVRYSGASPKPTLVPLPGAPTPAAAPAMAPPPALGPSRLQMSGRQAGVAVAGSAAPPSAAVTPPGAASAGSSRPAASTPAPHTARGAQPPSTTPAAAAATRLPTPAPTPAPVAPTPDKPSASKPTSTSSPKPTPTPAPAPAPSPPRDPNAELSANPLPERLTSSNPYTLYDMPLPSRPLREAWRTPAERSSLASSSPASPTPPLTPDPADRSQRPRSLVFVTAEAAPWSKTGGLGDVLGSLPRSLAARGHRVMVVSPRYLAPSTRARYEGLAETGVRARLDLGGGPGGGGVHDVGFLHTQSGGVDWVFVDHVAFHREGTPYGNAQGTYGDNLFRFSLLSLAACEAPLLLHLSPCNTGSQPGTSQPEAPQSPQQQQQQPRPYGQDVTFIANDWHAGLVPVYLAARYRRHGVYGGARCVLALHNLAHQGAHPPHLFPSLGLPPEWYGACEWVDTGAAAAGAEGGSGGEGGRRKPTINVLKAALVTSDALVTVSPAYAWEITRSADAVAKAAKEQAATAAAGSKAAAAASTPSRPASASSSTAPAPPTSVGASASSPSRSSTLPRSARSVPNQPLPTMAEAAARVAAVAAAGPGGGGEGAEQGMGLTALLSQRAADLTGIVNGIDTGEWDPRTDPYIPRNYHEGSLGGKGLCKAALQGELGLPVDPAAPLLAFIGRLDWQKGPDLVLGALPALVAAGCQVVLLGSGAPDYEAALSAAQAAHPAAVRAHVGFSVPLSHRMLAAADVLLMPSRFEPCGLNQMYAMRYGTVPVAHGTGGLRDTIDDVNPFAGEEHAERGTSQEEIDELFATGLAWGRPTAPRSADDPSLNHPEHSPYSDYFLNGIFDGDDDAPGAADAADYVGTGWTFAPATVEALVEAVSAALAVYERLPDKWRSVQLAGMRRDSSWGRAARQWEAVLERAHAAAAYSK